MSLKPKTIEWILEYSHAHILTVLKGKRVKCVQYNNCHWQQVIIEHSVCGKLMSANHMAESENDFIAQAITHLIKQFSIENFTLSDDIFFLRTVLFSAPFSILLDLRILVSFWQSFSDCVFYVFFLFVFLPGCKANFTDRTIKLKLKVPPQSHLLAPPRGHWFPQSCFLYTQQPEGTVWVWLWNLLMTQHLLTHVTALPILTCPLSLLDIWPPWLLKLWWSILNKVTYPGSELNLVFCLQKNPTWFVTSEQVTAHTCVVVDLGSLDI